MRPEEEIGCIGHYGYGGALLAAQYAKDHDGNMPPGGALHCNQKCSLGATCWEKHKERARRLFPKETALLDELSKAFKGPALVAEWHSRFGTPDPYMALLMANTEDGMDVGFGGRPKERGHATLRLPFGD